MKKRFFVSLLTLTWLSGIGFAQAMADETVNEDVTVSAGKPLAFPQQEKIANLAVAVLKHIAKARGFIHDKNATDAKRELADSRKLMEEIRAALPTTQIKDRIWVAKKHLSYETSEEVIPDLVPIYTSLDDVQSFITVDETRSHLNEAEKALKAGNKEKGEKELGLAENSLVYVEIDMPLSYTDRKVAEALHLLAEGKETDADQALKEAEDGIQVISISSYGPMVLAQESLWQATKEYAKGEYETARRFLAEAKTFLKMAAKQADEKTKEELAKLDRKIGELENEDVQKRHGFQ